MSSFCLLVTEKNFHFLPYLDLFNDINVRRTNCYGFFHEMFVQACEIYRNSSFLSSYYLGWSNLQFHYCKKNYFSLIKLMISHDVSCSTITNQIAFDQPDGLPVPFAGFQIRNFRFHHFYLIDF